MTRRRRHDPIPLTEWIRGQVHVHFRSGHVAVLQTSLHSAHSIRMQAEDSEGGEAIDGLESHDGWVAVRSDEVVLTEWTPSPDYGWRGTSPSDRRRLRSLAMSHGILCALADLWAGPGQKPSYSIASVATLFRLATSRGVSREEWDQVAVIVQGEDGARLVESLWDGYEGTGVPQGLLVDLTETYSTSSDDTGDLPGDGSPRAAGDRPDEGSAEDRHDD